MAKQQQRNSNNGSAYDMPKKGRNAECINTCFLVLAPTCKIIQQYNQLRDVDHIDTISTKLGRQHSELLVYCLCKYVSDSCI